MNQGTLLRIKWSILLLPRKFGKLNPIDLHINRPPYTLDGLTRFYCQVQFSFFEYNKILRFAWEHVQLVVPVDIYYYKMGKTSQLCLFNTCTFLTKSMSLTLRDFNVMVLSSHTCLLLPIKGISYILSSASSLLRFVIRWTFQVPFTKIITHAFKQGFHTLRLTIFLSKPPTKSLRCWG